MPLNLTIYLDTADNVLSVRHAVDFNELGRGFLGVFIAQRLPLTKLGDLEYCISQVILSDCGSKEFRLR